MKAFRNKRLHNAAQDSLLERLARAETMIESLKETMEAKDKASEKALEIADKQLEDWYVTKDKLNTTINTLMVRVFGLFLTIVGIAITLAGTIISVIKLWNFQ